MSNAPTYYTENKQGQTGNIQDNSNLFSAEVQAEFEGQEITSIFSEVQNSQNTQKTEWEEISSFDDVDELPNIDPELIPPIIKDYCLSCSEQFQTAFEMSLLCALASLATAVQGKFEISIKPDYVEPLNLYIIGTAIPSELKSPTLKKFRQALEEWENEKNTQEKEIIQALTSENKTLEKSIEARRAKAGKAKEREELKAIITEVKTLEEDLQDIPNYSRLLADDVTPESLGLILSQQNGKLAILEAEGGFFGTIAGRYNRGIPNLDLILKAYNGENIRIDRKGQQPIFINKPHLTLLFLIQPYLLKNRENSEAFKGRGLDSRFLYFFPSSKVGHRSFESPPINEQYARNYNNLIKNYLDMPLIEDKPYSLSMTKEAYAYYAEFMNTLEVAMRDGNELQNMRDWAGKKGHLGRLLGLLHCATDIQPHHKLIQLDEVQRACNIMTVLIAHAKRAYGYMFDNDELQTSKKILTWLKSSMKKDFSAKECFDGIRGKIKKQDEVNKGLLLLEDHSYIRKLPPTPKKVGRPSTQYEVNPKFWG